MPCSTRSRPPETTRPARAGTCSAKIKDALGKHALEEENVVYPALRQANRAHDADALNSEHGHVKTFLYELENMPANGPAWLARAGEFRALLEEHMRMEEDEIFPALKAGLTEEQNARLGAAMSREGISWPRCLVPTFDGALSMSEWKDALWDRFYTGAPARQRRSVERYNIVKRA